MMPYPIIAAVLFVGGYLTYNALKSRKKEKPPQAKRAENKPEEEKTESVKKTRNNTSAGWVVIIVAVIILTWGFSTSWGNKMTPPPPAAAGIQTVVKPAEEAVLKWSLPSGEYHRGLNSDTLKVKITAKNDREMWFETPYISDGKTQLGHYYLASTDGKRYDGKWSQKKPGDSGRIWLRKISDGLWVGSSTSDQAPEKIFELELEVK